MGSPGHDYIMYLINCILLSTTIYISKLSPWYVCNFHYYFYHPLVIFWFLCAKLPSPSIHGTNDSVKFYIYYNYNGIQNTLHV